MSQDPEVTGLFPTLAIAGVGLIGGSIALAAKTRGTAGRVIGLGRNQVRLNAAVDAGLLDCGTTDAADLSEAKLIIVCTPVDRIVEDVLSIANAIPAESSTIITDAGSTKSAICNILASQLPRHITFVGSHPLAGSEKSGWEHASADLFEGRTCVVTPTEGTQAKAAGQIEQFWKALGMHTVQMSPNEHDAALARTSHLPHALASALASVLSDDDHPLAATGFRDTTRIAAGDPAIWAPIFLENAEALTAALDQYDARLAELRLALKHGDESAIVAFLESGKSQRDALDR